MLALGDPFEARWSAGIGDPTALGWITVVAYLVAAGLCLWTARRGDPTRVGPRWLWWGIGGLMLALAINKQLDLQSLFTEIGKDMAKRQGWYEQRRKFQFAFVLATAALGLVGTVIVAFALRRTWRRTALAIAGVFAILSYVVIRASSFHSIDAFIQWSPGGIRMNWVLELGGIAMLSGGAWWANRAAPAVR